MRYAWFLLALTLSALVVWGGFGFTQHAIILLDRWAAVAPDPVKVESVVNNTNNAALNLSRATQTWADSSEQQARDVRATLVKANRLIGDLREVAGKSGDEVDALRRTTDAATDSALALTRLLDEGKITVAAAQPVLGALTQSGNDLDAILKDKAILETITYIRSITESGAGIMIDGKKVADKATADWLKPVPKWKLPLKRVGQGWDILSAAARMVP